MKTLRQNLEKIIWRHYDPDNAINVEELLDEAMPVIIAEFVKLAEGLKDHRRRDYAEDFPGWNAALNFLISKVKEEK